MSFSIVYGCIMLFPTPKHSRYMFIGSEMLYKNCVKNSSCKSHVGHDIRWSLLIFKFKVRVYSVRYCKTNCLNIFNSKIIETKGTFLDMIWWEGFIFLIWNVITGSTPFIAYYKWIIIFVVKKQHLWIYWVFFHKLTLTNRCVNLIIY